MSLPPALAALGQYRQFISYALVPKGNGMFDKIPCDYRTGEIGINAHDPQYHTDYLTAAATGGPVAFVLTDNDPFFCLDIDHCLQADGTWSPTALAVVNDFPGAAVEVSISGKGLHIWGCYSQVPPHGCKNVQLGLELYHTKRFIALGQPNSTGNAWQDFTPHLSAAVSRYFPGKGVGAEVKAEWTDHPVPEWRGPTDDAELIRRALRSGASKAFGGGARFIDLWEKNDSVLANAYPTSNAGKAYDESSADAALAAHLRFWTGGDCERIKRLMLLSALVRDKWEREDYLPRTILAVCARGGDVLQDDPPPSLTAAPAQEIAAAPETPFVNPQEQITLFAGCVHVRDANKILLPDGEFLDEKRFNEYGAFSGRIYSLDGINSKTTKKAWECFMHSQVFRFPRVAEGCFRPDLQPRQVFTLPSGRTCINTYIPLGVPRVSGDPAPFLDLLKRMMPNIRDREIILAYMAAVVQHPGVKFQWAPLIQGVEGNGKSTINECLARAVGWEYCYTARASQIAKQFNSWMDRKILILVNDIYLAGQNKEVIEELKPMITETRQEIEYKGVDKAMREICANFILNTNHKDGIRKTRNDRRFAPFYTAQQDAADLARDGLTDPYFRSLRNWLENDGYAIIAGFLHSYQIPVEMNPAMGGRAPATSSTEEAIQVGRDDLEQEIIEAIDQGRPGFAGGWVSSFAFDRLLNDRKIKLSHNKRRSILEGLGYAYHPKLREGRISIVMSDQGMTGKPRLFIKHGHISANLTQAADILRAYQDAQINTDRGGAAAHSASR